MRLHLSRLAVSSEPKACCEGTGASAAPPISRPTALHETSTDNPSQLLCFCPRCVIKYLNQFGEFMALVIATSLFFSSVVGDVTDKR